MAEVTPVFLSVGQVEYRLQLLPNKGGVRVTSSFHPRTRCSRNKISTGSFVLKDNAYGVESQLCAIMVQGYKQIGDDRPSLTDNPLYALHKACSEAAAHELPAPKQR